MSNTKERIISAIVMALVVIAAVYFGKSSTLFVILVASILCIDELLINFVKLNRKMFIYKYVVIFFSLFFIVINGYKSPFSLTVFTLASLVMNIFLIYYLFKIPLASRFIKNSTEKNPAIVAMLVALPMLSFGIHFESQSWRQILGILLIVTYSMDTGAWFIGKNFGKHKLWPSVSPKKTIEGFIGGIIIAAVCGSLAWNGFFGEFKWYYSVIFAMCGAMSQVGDLIQSKIKREFEIKDSSNLIPGHGGVYDRIDSLIFLSPFFVIVVKYLGQQISL